MLRSHLAADQATVEDERVHREAALGAEALADRVEQHRLDVLHHMRQRLVSLADGIAVALDPRVVVDDLLGEASALVQQRLNERRVDFMAHRVAVGHELQQVLVLAI